MQWLSYAFGGFALWMIAVAVSCLEKHRIRIPVERQSQELATPVLKHHVNQSHHPEWPYTQNWRYN